MLGLIVYYWLELRCTGGNSVLACGKYGPCMCNVDMHGLYWLSYWLGTGKFRGFRFCTGCRVNALLHHAVFSLRSNTVSTVTPTGQPDHTCTLSRHTTATALSRRSTRIC
jgi:hypothetical protein